MRISTARRLAQIFFFAAFVWLALVATVGTGWTQWRGWPIALVPAARPAGRDRHGADDPLVASRFAWALATIVLTIAVRPRVLRVCVPVWRDPPVRRLAWTPRARRPKEKIAANAYRPAQAAKVLHPHRDAGGRCAVRGKHLCRRLQIGLLDPMPLVCTGASTWSCCRQGDLASETMVSRRPIRRGRGADGRPVRRRLSC
jgi:hypothetical protein